MQESDLNVKLIVLDRLNGIKNDHLKVMQSLVMDLLRALSCPNMDIRKKTLAIALDLVTANNVDEVVLNLKREVIKAQEEDDKVVGSIPPPLHYVGVVVKRSLLHLTTTTRQCTHCMFCCWFNRASTVSC
jgi:vesicle coat complex subunit